MTSFDWFPEPITSAIKYKIKFNCLALPNLI